MHRSLLSFGALLLSAWPYLDSTFIKLQNVISWNSHLFCITFLLDNLHVCISSNCRGQHCGEYGVAHAAHWRSFPHCPWLDLSLLPLWCKFDTASSNLTLFVRIASFLPSTVLLTTNFNLQTFLNYLHINYSFRPSSGLSKIRACASMVQRIKLPFSKRLLSSLYLYEFSHLNETDELLAADIRIVR